MVVLDAMGSDNAPAPEVEGALLAMREWKVPLTLVGRGDALRPLLEKSGTPASAWPRLIEAEDVVTMDDSPTAALRRKKKSSLRVGCDLVAAGEAGAFVTMGNTGAAMATAKVVCGMIEGIDRPALATWVPTSHGPGLLLDVGANVDCKPLHYVQFAHMACALMGVVLGNGRPTVGLLNIGEEEHKGTDIIREAHAALKTAGLDYRGFVEPADVFEGTTQVVVTDGWTGNVVLKTAEGVFEALTGEMKSAFRKNALRMAGAAISRGVFKDLKKKYDYSVYGGVPLLGVNAVTIIGHGRSNGWAVANAVRVAHEHLKGRLPERIAASIHSGPAAEAVHV